MMKQMLDINTFKIKYYFDHYLKCDREGLNSACKLSLQEVSRGYKM